MSLIVAGTVRAPTENLDGLRPHMLAMMTATRAEDGCEAYAYAEDVAEPGLIRIFEIWRDQGRRSTRILRPRTWPPGARPGPVSGCPTAISRPMRSPPNGRSSQDFS